jgi:uncharacterized membrane protein
MAERVERVVEEPATNTGATREVTTVRTSSSVVLARIIWWIAGVILALLAFRFVLALLGANHGNAFVRFIFDASHPLVAPFFGIFSYSNYVFGVARFELYTLVAMAVYAVIAWGLARLATLSHPNPRV